MKKWLLPVGCALVLSIFCVSSPVCSQDIGGAMSNLGHAMGGAMENAGSSMNSSGGAQPAYSAPRHRKSTRRHHHPSKRHVTHKTNKHVRK